MIDPIVEEIHRGRREQAARFHNDLAEFASDIQRRQAEDSAPYRTTPLKPRRVPAQPVATPSASVQ